MVNYGVNLGDYDPNKQPVYKLISNYFGNPKMTKVKNDNSISIYVTELTFLLNDKRYLVALVPLDRHPIGTNFEMEDLQWISFQTRVLTQNYGNVAKHNYQSKNQYPYDSPIYLKKREEEVTTYLSREFPIKISLLHKSPNLYEFPNKEGQISSALETFQTVVTFNFEK